MDIAKYIETRGLTDRLRCLVAWFVHAALELWQQPLDFLLMRSELLLLIAEWDTRKEMVKCLAAQLFLSST
jgi:hypothetical protein